jgi:DNA-binding HxlR family transcriptional regulator
MAKRSYEQFCPLAQALDVLGERWTLLIVRDLLSGSKRYTDLRRGLPGLATDLLTERLRALEEAGLVHRRDLPPPASATVYELTERGRELEQPLFALARFGLGLLAEAPDASMPPQPNHLGLLLRVLFKPERAPARPETWVFESAGARLGLTVSENGLTLHRDEDVPVDADARFVGPAPTIFGLVAGRLDVRAALADGRLKVEGDRKAVDRMRAAFVPTA